MQQTSIPSPFEPSQRDLQVIPVEYVRLLRELAREKGICYSGDELMDKLNHKRLSQQAACSAR